MRLESGKFRIGHHHIGEFDIAQILTQNTHLVVFERDEILKHRPNSWVVAIGVNSKFISNRLARVPPWCHFQNSQAVFTI